MVMAKRVFMVEKKLKLLRPETGKDALKFRVLYGAFVLRANGSKEAWFGLLPGAHPSFLHDDD